MTLLDISEKHIKNMLSDNKPSLYRITFCIDTMLF